MQLKQLNDTNTMVPEIGLGTWNYKGGIEPLRKGIESGAFLIDTAEGYGTEEIVGQAIKGIRDKVFLATKVSGRHLRYNDVLKAAEGSLRRLGTDYIDLYQIHWPNPSVPIKETMRAMETLVDSGLVRYIGVSNFSLKELIEAQSAMSKYPIVSNQVPYCQEHKITIIAYTPLDNGQLARTNRRTKDRKIQVLEQIANEIGKTPAQVALNWCISHPNVIAIPKSDSVERVIENCQASGWKLSQEHMDLLNKVFS